MTRAQLAVFVVLVIVIGATIYFSTLRSSVVVAQGDCEVAVAALKGKAATTDERQALRTQLRDCLRSEAIKYTDVAALLAI